MWKSKVILTILLTVTLGVSAQNISWFAFDSQYDTYVPVVSPTNKMSFFLKKEETGKLLKIDFPKDAAMFIDNKLVYLAKAESASVELSVDSLFRVYRGDSLFLSFYNDQVLSDLYVKLEHPQPETSSDIFLDSRASNLKSSFEIILLIFALTLVGIWKNQANVHAVGHLDINLLFTSKSRDNTMYNTSYFQLDNVQFFSVLSLLLSMIAMYMRVHFPYLIFFWSDTSIMSLIISWIANAATYYAIFYLKFVVVGLISQIFNFRNFKYIHFYDFIRFVYLASLVFMFVTLLDFMTNGWFFGNLIQALLFIPIILIVVHIAITFQKLNKLYSNRKLHLFSYLCVTEIIPIVLIIKISR